MFQIQEIPQFPPQHGTGLGWCEDLAVAWNQMKKSLLAQLEFRLWVWCLEKSTLSTDHSP